MWLHRMCLIKIRSLCLLKMGLKIQLSTGLTFTVVCTLTRLQKVALKYNQNDVISLKLYIFEMRRLSIEMKLGTMTDSSIYLFICYHPISCFSITFHH